MTFPNKAGKIVAANRCSPLGFNILLSESVEHEQEGDFNIDALEALIH